MIEQDINVLNAYITSDLTDDISITAGRFVTSWGEATFIPVGMNVDNKCIGPCFFKSSRRKY